MFGNVILRATRLLQAFHVLFLTLFKITFKLQTVFVRLFILRKLAYSFLDFKTLESSLLCPVACSVCFGDDSGTVDNAKSCAKVMFTEQLSCGHVSRALCWKCHPCWEKAFF